MTQNAKTYKRGLDLGALDAERGEDNCEQRARLYMCKRDFIRGYRDGQKGKTQ